MFNITKEEAMIDQTECLCNNWEDIPESDGVRRCVDCGREQRLVPNGPDDCEWEDVDD